MCVCVYVCVADIEMRNRHGYLSAVDYPALVVSGVIVDATTSPRMGQM